MTAAGAAGAVVTAPAAGTGVGAVVPAASAAVAVAGTVVVAHGANTAVNGATNAVNTLKKENTTGSSSSSSNTTTGTSASGQATDAHGNKLGGSGKPQRHSVDHSTRKGAKDAARQQGDRAPVEHSNPKKGKPHFHASDEKGKKKPGSTHHNYPRR
jgi:hypothetical protein